MGKTTIPFFVPSFVFVCTFINLLIFITVRIMQLLYILILFGNFNARYWVLILGLAMLLGFV